MPAKKIIAFPSAAPRQKHKRDKGQKPAQLVREALFSFLKDTRGMISWSGGDLAETLGVTLAQANDALPILEMQGYIKRMGKEEWLTTIAGESVSESVAPHYKKEAVESALGALQDRIRKLNADRSAAVSVVNAVAYGDFLSGRARVQAADVGIELKTRGTQNAAPAKQLLTSLRAKSPLLHVDRFEPWMAVRTHRRLI